MDLLLIRHAEPIRIENQDGPADPPLHERGRVQADRLAAWLATEPVPVNEIWSSPMRRARQTADACAQACGLDIHVGQLLAEWDRESPSYVPIEELRAAKDERWDALVSGDAMREHVDPVTFREGVVAGIEEIIAANSGRRVAVVCHGGVVNMYVTRVLGLAAEHFFLPHYTSITRIAAARTGERSVASLNETGHLRGLAGF
ncbi:MAG TPA: histidine phosphatase family protein [Acidimicrobiales bacterium]|jgi:broad specificity phosphatase PhoE|nr:histidine phosphatase family protein [Acidimicrobiales bacterium]